MQPAGITRFWSMIVDQFILEFTNMKFQEHLRFLFSLRPQIASSEEKLSVCSFYAWIHGVFVISYRLSKEFEKWFSKVFPFSCKRKSIFASRYCMRKLQYLQVCVTIHWTKIWVNTHRKLRYSQPAFSGVQWQLYYSFPTHWSSDNPVICRPPQMAVGLGMAVLHWLAGRICHTVGVSGMPKSGKSIGGSRELEISLLI